MRSPLRSFREGLKEKGKKKKKKNKKGRNSRPSLPTSTAGSLGQRLGFLLLEAI